MRHSKIFTILCLSITLCNLFQVSNASKSGKVKDKNKSSGGSSSPKASVLYHSSKIDDNDGFRGYQEKHLIAQESRPNGKRQTYSHSATQRPVSYSHSYDSGPQYYESNNPPQSYYREYRSPPSSYNVDYNERPRSSSYNSNPQRQQHRSSYNNQDSNEHRDADEQSYDSDNDQHNNADEYGGNDSSNEYRHDDSHGDDDYGHSPSTDVHQTNNGRGSANLEY